MTPVLLLTLISLPSWASLSAWHRTFPPESGLYVCRSSCWGALLPTPCSTSSHHFISMFSTPCSGESSLTLPPAPRAPALPLCHIHQIANSYVISCWTKTLGEQGCVLLMVLSWLLTRVDSRSLLNGWLKDE